jgi:Ni/Co efflux regulator RcnB
MNVFIRSAVAITILAAITGFARAQYIDDPHRNLQQPDYRQRGADLRDYPARYRSVEHHSVWHRGERMNRDDWERARPVDWRSYALPAPPAGHDWRELGGAFICAGIADALIFNIMIHQP